MLFRADAETGGLIPETYGNIMPTLTPENAYTQMQRTQYESEADLMNRENHGSHNRNPDYWNILIGDTETGFEEKVGLDFGCGCGRNVQNLWKRFRRMDGVDISAGNLGHARENLLADGAAEDRFRLHHCNGVNLDVLPNDEYDFLMSTIVLQHICVHEIRFSYMQDFFRVLKPGGLLSFQMGFGEKHGKAEYYDNDYHALATNSLHDTKVTDPRQLQEDLERIGFVDVQYALRPPFEDGHSAWIFVKARKPDGNKLGQSAPLKGVSPGNRPRLHLLMSPQDVLPLTESVMTYQQAQFTHLAGFADVTWFDGTTRIPAQATICFDEKTLLTNAPVIQDALHPDSLFVLVTHDFWCHPLRVAAFLRQQKRSLLVLRHESARQLFQQIAPEIPSVVQRPGVEIFIFHPMPEPKQYDIILAGSETPDYPMRQKLNRIVRENAKAHGWKVLDLADVSAMSRSLSVTQSDYAPLLASAKISPTGTNRGGGHGAKLVMQYFDMSEARTHCDDEFHGFQHPEIVTLTLDTAGITPRYLESLACKTLLMGDIPKGESEDWYRDKMVEVTPEMSDSVIVSILDHILANDGERETLCEYAYTEVCRTETSEHKAKELAEIIAAHV
jgi:ubiquinone/menaquinone biosynthesis C-methylase UbiE